MGWKEVWNLENFRSLYWKKSQLGGGGAGVYLASLGNYEA
jgi:hypothetical protein